MMSSVADKARGPAGRRRYDAAASRQALLEAAGRLFHEQGYDATTVREVGEAAGVDAALIARYFGSKEGLYLAAVAEASPTEPTRDPVELLERVLRASDTRGLGPIARAVVSSSSSESIHGRVSEVVAERVVRPLTEDFEARGLPQAPLRAELVFAIVVGVSLARTGGTLPALRDAELADVSQLLAP